MSCNTSNTTNSSSNAPTNFTPLSTTPPSTTIPSISTNISTSLSSSSPQTTIPTNQSCVYHVSDCLNCDQSIELIQSDLLNVSCEFSKNKWSWVFKNSSSGDFFLSSNLTLSNQIIFQSNLVVQSNASISFSFASNNNGSSPNTPLVIVDGCVKLKGDLNILIDFKVKQEENFDLMRYNCSESALLKNDHVNVIYNEQQNPCLKSNSKVTLNTISATINSCEKKIGLILGLAIGIPFALILIVVVSLFVARKLLKSDAETFQKKYNQNTTNNDTEMQDWKNNSKHKTGTEWKEFEKI